MHVGRPDKNEYDAFYEGYVGQTTTSDIHSILKNQLKESIAFFEGLPDGIWDYRYDTGKWSVKEMLIHMCDAERIFAYRAIRIARGDSTPLQGFDHNNYVNFYNASGRNAQTVIQEFRSVRDASLSLFNSFSQADFLRMGVASGFGISVRALAFIIAGHMAHHRGIIESRYLPGFANA